MWWAVTHFGSSTSPSQTIAVGTATQLTGEDGLEVDAARSPDGKLLAVTASDETLALYPVDGGGSVRAVPGWKSGAKPIQWSADGGSLYFVAESNIPVEILRFDLATGQSQAWRQLAPSDRAGVQSISSPLITPDGRTYAYTYLRLTGDLYLAEALK
jgi:WD40 repeat protein